MARGRPKLVGDAATEAAERRRQQSAERMRHMRERRRAEMAVRPEREPAPAPPPLEVMSPPAPRRSGGIAGDRLRSYVERIERLEAELSGSRRRNPALADAYAAERRSVQEDINDVYADAKAAGFTVAVLREVIRIRRMGRDHQALIPLYLEALEP